MPTETSSPGTDDARGASETAASWYALRVRSNHERTVERYLRYEGAECWLPVYSAESRWSDRTKRVDRVLFPGYLFVRCASVSSVLEISGVCGVLGGNLTPAAVPDSELDAVRKVLASMLPVSPVEYCGSLHPGDAVTVRSGAMKGVSGRVLKHAKGLRLVVSVEMLGRAVAVELDSALLAKEMKAAA